jgi:hypothetical protein
VSRNYLHINLRDTILHHLSRMFAPVAGRGPTLRLQHAIHANYRACTQRCAATAQRSASQQPAIHNETPVSDFYAESTIGFAQLGLNSTMVQALAGAGYDRPSLVQVHM